MGSVDCLRLRLRDLTSFCAFKPAGAADQAFLLTMRNDAPPPLPFRASLFRSNVPLLLAIAVCRGFLPQQSISSLRQIIALFRMRRLAQPVLKDPQKQHPKKNTKPPPPPWFSNSTLLGLRFVSIIVETSHLALLMWVSPCRLSSFSSLRRQVFSLVVRLQGVAPLSPVFPVPILPLF